MEMEKSSGEDSNSEEKVIMSLCNTHCGGQCLLQVHVKDGVITRIATDEGEEPQIRCCWRGHSQRKRVYAPDRLKFPVKRVDFDHKGERHAENRGISTYERITWDEALDTVASEIKRVRETYGSGAIIFRGGAADIGILQSRTTIDRLFGISGGYSQTWGYISYEGGRFASLATFGNLFTRNSRNDLLNSRLIILWGINPSHTVQDANTCWYLAQCKEAGIRIVSIDPRYNDTAATFAEQWIPIIPGTDAAMMIAMAYVMITENLQDQKFLDTYTIGFDRFKDYVLGIEDGVPKTPAWAEAISGVPAATIGDLAREYATTKPAALVAGIAPGRTAYGDQYHRCAHTMAAMTGNIGIPGGDTGGRYWTALGGFPYMKFGPGMKVMNPVDEAAPPRKYSLMGEEVRDKGRINTSLIADAILKGKEGGYPFDYKMLYIMNSNYLNQAPNLNKTIQAFRKLEFIVTQEQFMTPNAKFSDIVLPVNTFLERNDVTIGEGVPFYGFMNKAVDSLYESKSQFEIGCELAARLGITDYNDKTEEEWMRSMVAGSEIPDYDEFKRKGVYRSEVGQHYIAFQKEIEDSVNHPFPTPSGKIEIYSQRLANLNDPEVPPIPRYVETWESRNDPLAKKYPLQLFTTHAKRRAHTQFETIPWLRELQPQMLEINPVDAEARGIRHGDEVMVFNDRGKTIVRADVTKRIMPGVINLPEGAWYDPDENGVDRVGSANVLTNDRLSGAASVPYNTNLVQVQKV